MTNIIYCKKYEPTLERQLICRIHDFKNQIGSFGFGERFENVNLDLIVQKTKKFKEGLEEGLLDKLLIEESREYILDNINKGILFPIKCSKLRKKNKHIELKICEIMEQLLLLMEYNFMFSEKEILFYCDKELASFIRDYQNPIPILK
jgi:hypothetical protein